MRAVCGYFCVVGSVALVVGVHDVLLAVELTFRLVAAVVAAIGAALLASAVGFARRRFWCYGYAVAAAAAAATLSMLFLLAQAVTGARDLSLLVWLTLGALSTGAAVAAAREGRVSFSGLARRRVQLASSVLSIGAFLSIAQFWNAAIREPPTSAPSLSIAPELEQLPAKRCRVDDATTDERSGEEACLTPVAVAVAVRNSSSAKVWVLGSLYQAWGVVARERLRQPPEYIALLERASRAEELVFGTARHVSERYERVVETGSLPQEFTYLVPGEEITFDLVLYVPPGEYDLLRFHTSVAFAKDTLVLEETDLERPRLLPAGGENGGARVVVHRDVRETSWLGRALRGRRYVAIELQIARAEGFDEPVPNLLVQVRRRGAPATAEAESLRLARLYGLASAESWYELDLRPE